MFHRILVQTAEKHSETAAKPQKHCQSVLGASKSYVKMEQKYFYEMCICAEYNNIKSILSSLESIYFHLSLNETAVSTEQPSKRRKW